MNKKAVTFGADIITTIIGIFLIVASIYLLFALAKIHENDGENELRSLQNKVISERHYLNELYSEKDEGLTLAEHILLSPYERDSEYLINNVEIRVPVDYTSGGVYDTVTGYKTRMVVQTLENQENDFRDFFIPTHSGVLRVHFGTEADEVMMVG